MDQSKKQNLLIQIDKERLAAEDNLKTYLDSITIKRNRTSLVMTSFMHNVVNVEGAVESDSQILYWTTKIIYIFYDNNSMRSLAKVFLQDGCGQAGYFWALAHAQNLYLSGKATFVH